MEIIVLDGQSLVDVAIQWSGSAQAVFDLAVLNNVSITDQLSAGDMLLKALPHNQRIADYYKTKGLTPSTDIVFSKQPEGMEHWALEIDFKISEE